MSLLGPIRVGVVGVGKMGSFHVQKYQELTEARLVGIYDSDPNVAEAVGTRFKVKAFASLAELLYEVDAISIAAATPFHFSLAKQAIEAGVDVLLEKPLCQTSIESFDLAALAEKNGRVLQAGFVERVRSRWMLADQPIEGWTFVRFQRQTPRLGREPGIDVVSDLMIHDLDLLLSLTGEPPQLIRATGGSVVSGTWDWVQTDMTFSLGRHAQLFASRVHPEVVRSVDIIAPRLTLAIDLAKGQRTRLVPGAESSVSTELMPNSDALLEQCQEFLRAVQGVPSQGVNAFAAATAQQLSEHILNRLVAPRSGVSTETVER